jgi:hypothetical protein
LLAGNFAARQSLLSHQAAGRSSAVAKLWAARAHHERLPDFALAMEPRQFLTYFRGFDSFAVAGRAPAGAA